MQSSLRRRFERLGSVRVVEKNHGTPIVLTLTAAGDENPVNVIAGSMSLARRGLSLLTAKRTMEAVAGGIETTFDLPSADRPSDLVGELALAGLSATILSESGGQ